MSTSKPILGGGVAGSKYLPISQPKDISPQAIIGNSKIVRDSMSLNHSGTKNIKNTTGTLMKK